MLKSKINILFLGTVIAFVSVVVGSIAMSTDRYGTTPHYTVIYKNPAGPWPGQNSYGNARSGFADAQPSIGQNRPAARTWNI